LNQSLSHSFSSILLFHSIGLSASSRQSERLELETAIPQQPLVNRS
ncbi:unnamed protein product, partial [Musa banksii]